MSNKVEALLTWTRAGARESSKYGVMTPRAHGETRLGDSQVTVGSSQSSAGMVGSQAHGM